MDCAKLFNIDSLMDGFVPWCCLGGAGRQRPRVERFIVERREDRLVVQASYLRGGAGVDEMVTVTRGQDPGRHRAAAHRPAPGAGALGAAGGSQAGPHR